MSKSECVRECAFSPDTEGCVADLGSSFIFGLVLTLALSLGMFCFCVLELLGGRSTENVVTVKQNKDFCRGNINVPLNE